MQDELKVKEEIEEAMNRVLEKLEILEVHGIESGPEYHSLLFELGELETKMSEYG